MISALFKHSELKLTVLLHANPSKRRIETDVMKMYVLTEHC